MARGPGRAEQSGLGGRRQAGHRRRAADAAGKPAKKVALPARRRGCWRSIPPTQSFPDASYDRALFCFFLLHEQPASHRERRAERSLPRGQARRRDRHRRLCAAASAICGRPCSPPSSRFRSMRHPVGGSIGCLRPRAADGASSPSSAGSVGDRDQALRRSDRHSLHRPATRITSQAVP